MDGRVELAVREKKRFWPLGHVDGHIRMPLIKSWQPLKDDGVRTILEAQGDEVAYSTPKDFATYVDAETVKWTQVVKIADLRLD